MAQRTTATRKYTAAHGFPGGINSGIDPLLLGSGQAQWAVNAVCKGGVWQTRPGFKSRLTLSTGFAQISNWWVSAGKPGIWPQFLVTFKPNNGTTYLVYGLAGSVWYSVVNADHSLSSPAQLPLTFDPDVRTMHAVACVQSAEVTSGVVATRTPRRVLIIQDGINHAGYWDGESAGHLEPKQNYTQNDAGDTIYTDGYNQTPIGTWMAWSGNRLWVVNGNTVYASDINNPLGFTEQITLVNVPYITFPSEITGIYDRGTAGTTSSRVWVFTDDTVYTLASGVQDRSTWRTTADWQAKIYGGTGCIAGKSITAHRGLLYWYSADGVVRSDGTGTVNSTQAIPPIDTPMIGAKTAIANVRRNMIAAAGFDSYVIMAVPAGAPVRGQVVNGHMHVMDLDTMPGTSQSAWQGVWTGINPVEFATVKIGGQTVQYALSYDDDGVTRIWETFQGNRADNGHPIPWSVETQVHLVSDDIFSNHKIAHIAVALSQVIGDVGVQGYWRGLRGQYHRVLNTSLVATPGSILIPSPDFTPIVNATDHFNCRKQTRLLKSEDIRGSQDDTDASGVEGPYTDAVSPGFQLMFQLQGCAAIRAYRIAHEIWADNTEGEVLDAETGLNVLPQNRDIDPAHLTGNQADLVLADDLQAYAIAPVEASREVPEYAAPAIDDFSLGYAETDSVSESKAYRYFKLSMATQPGTQLIEVYEMALGTGLVWLTAEAASDNGHLNDNPFYSAANAIDGVGFTGDTAQARFVSATGTGVSVILRYSSAIEPTKLRIQPSSTDRAPIQIVVYGSNSGNFSGEEKLLAIFSAHQPSAWTPYVYKTFDFAEGVMPGYGSNPAIGRD